ncbi:angiopoietin-related protein 7-like [Drosophila nasuta]|uniref:angiopoietin-related protein 7-like n=1 Tax=Drosophila nasuta TaxID=42062 RepID=UPI00295E20E0|nr:angiopoietin-related protein 7-like [Drosophila nasuta]
MSLLVIFLGIFLGGLSTSHSEFNVNNELDAVENNCAAYCLNLFLKSNEFANNKLKSCEMHSKQMSVLQSELVVLKLKEEISEKKLKKADERCTKTQEQLDTDLHSIKNLLYHLTNQSRDEAKRLKEQQKQIGDYRDLIEEKNDIIRALQSKLEIYEYSAKILNFNVSLIPPALIIKHEIPEQQIKIYETSCLSMGNSSDILEIQVPGMQPFSVACDGDIAGPGWTVIQRRVDNSVYFNRSWNEYRNGFGDLEKSFFMGLEKIHHITKSQNYELYIHLESFNGTVRYARYNKFGIGNETDAYELKVLGAYSGDAGDALVQNINMKFTTFDRDNDKFYSNCASERDGGWWYNQCARSNLNGRYYESEMDVWAGIWWWNWQETRTLKAVHMLIRPTNTTIVKN